MPPDTTSARIEREFRGLGGLFPDSQARQREIIRQSDVRRRPDGDAQAIAGLRRNFKDWVAAYKSACVDAMNELSRLAEVSQEELDSIWRKHTKAMFQLEKFYIRNAVLTNALSTEVASRACEMLNEQASTIADMDIADDLLDKLNLPFRRQLARQTCPQNVALVEAHYASRVQRADQLLKALRDWDYTSATPSQLFDNFWMWRWIRSEIDDRHSDLRATVGNHLLLDFWPADGEKQTLLPAEQELDEEFSRQREGADDAWQEEDELEVEDFDDGINVNWTSQDFADLREHLALPIKVNINVTLLASLKEPDLRQRQFLDNQCPICVQEYTEPAELAGCHHIFCFECIVPWVGGYKKCPKCREAADLDHLTIYEISRVEGALSDEEPLSYSLGPSRTRGKEQKWDEPEIGLQEFTMSFFTTPGGVSSSTLLPEVSPSAKEDGVDKLSELMGRLTLEQNSRPHDGEGSQDRSEDIVKGHKDGEWEDVEEDGERLA